jgi:AraC-like DNA-binding protein
VSKEHDQQSEILAQPSEREAKLRVRNLDPLSDVLQAVRLRGALFFMMDTTSPWCIEIPHAASYADIILPSAQHIVSYHIVVEGSGLAKLSGFEPISYNAGDIIVFPRTDPYLLYGAPGALPELDQNQTLQFFHDAAAGRVPSVIAEGGGQPPEARFICGFLGCDLDPFNPLLATLPPIVHLSRPETGRYALLDQLVDLTVQELRNPRAGGDRIRIGLSELMFVEVLRLHLESVSPSDPGWLAGLRDPVVGCAMGLFHADPSRHWNLEQLADEVGASRSVLAERFTRIVGETPMRYLRKWRMQLAARLLTETTATLATICGEVGFRSEFAFSRAFKSETGLSPSQWRRKRAL